MSQQIQTNTGRIAYWDNLKAFLIFTVVLGHFLLDLTSKGGVINSLFDYIYIYLLYYKLGPRNFRMLNH